VRETALRLIEEIRSGSGPQFLEVMTYRFRGHSMGDPERYRKPEEVHKWQEEDPIGIFRKHILKNKLAKEAELNKLDDEAMAIIEDAAAFAEASPEPAPEELWKHIYADETVEA
jgi:pyruvate dehydrogenase E1 component alpha subunit